MFRWHSWLLLGFVCIASAAALAQGGPPYYTNDPGTPGSFNWEINVGYMPFYYTNQSVSHTPDLDINFGLGDRIQLTYENAWLRVQNPAAPIQFGLGQSNFGVKWRFYDAGENGWQFSTFPQGFVNNPNNAVRRGIVPATDTFLLPIEMTHKLGPLDFDFEAGYQAVHNGPNGWTAGVVLGKEITPRVELDTEFYSQGNYRRSSEAQPLLDAGARIKLHRPVILLLMAGRAVEPAKPNQAYFVGYFGVQFLLPKRAYKEAEPDFEKSPK